MNIIVLSSFGILVLLLISAIIILYLLWMARKTLIKGGKTWSAKELPIKRNYTDKKISFLKEIQEQSEEFLNSEDKS
tara:strand:+ start:1443 stop:1673 length:231 start_codon:yes stop_codon:yes gene_type:complete